MFRNFVGYLLLSSLLESPQTSPVGLRGSLRKKFISSDRIQFLRLANQGLLGDVSTVQIYLGRQMSLKSQGYYAANAAYCRLRGRSVCVPRDL